MARATVHMQTQIGVEDEKGTAVAADVILPGVSFDAGLRPDVSSFRPAGQKYATVASLTREWVEAAIRGQPCYEDLVYLLAGILCKPTITKVGTTTAYKAVYTLEPVSPDEIVTFTVEQGDPATYDNELLAHTWNYSLVTELGLEFTRTAAPSVTGRLMGRDYAPMDETMTAGTPLASVPVLPGDISIYLDDSLVGIGTTQLTDVSRVSWRIANRFNPRWVLDALEPGWSGEVELAPELTMTLRMGADAAGMGVLEHLRAGSSVFVQLEAESVTEAATKKPYSLLLKLAGKVTAVSDFSDDDGVYAVEWTVTASPELTDSAPLEVELVTKVDSL